MAWLSWREAMERALYGPEGFYRRPEGPRGHFRSSVHASPLYAAALLRLARSAELDTLVDVGAGSGELLRALHGLDPSLRLYGVEVADRPGAVPATVAWSTSLPTGLTALLVANEWLDNVPCDVVEVDEGGEPRLVQVDPETGAERLGEPVGKSDAEWLREWWPLGGAAPGDRAEVGRPRDEAWASAVSSLGAGVAVAADYGHTRQTRPPYGTLCGYRDGRVVAPVPDGTRDVTAHVALDACAAAGERAGASATLLTVQRAALKALGVDGSRPPYGLARSDPAAYLRQMQLAGEAGELLDPDGLGGFGWLMQSIGPAVPFPGFPGPFPGERECEGTGGPHGSHA